MRKIAVLVPSYNEELVIQKTISSVLAAGFDSADVFVVDDCSTDKTVALVLQTNVNILPLRKNGGKAKALNAAIEYFDLYKKYDYIAFLDADSTVSSNFKQCIQQHVTEFPLVDLFVGQVKTHEGNYISSYRAMEYTFAHDFYKSGQSNFNLVYVAPGCASVYATKTLQRLHLSGDTLAEDMDLTMQVHRNGGLIKYIPELIVYTQDPETFKDYTKQVTRWYRGNCQVMKKHNVLNVFQRKQRIDLYMILLVLEALIFNRNIFIVGVLAFFGFSVVAFILAVDITILFCIALYGAAKTKRLDVIYNFPFYFWLPYLNSYIFTKSFLETFVFNYKNLSWNKVKRYEMNTKNNLI